jgi:hypothetical protein
MNEILGPAASFIGAVRIGERGGWSLGSRRSGGVGEGGFGRQSWIVGDDNLWLLDGDLTSKKGQGDNGDIDTDNVRSVVISQVPRQVWSSKMPKEYEASVCEEKGNR